MGKGKPKAGFRKTYNWYIENGFVPPDHLQPRKPRSDRGKNRVAKKRTEPIHFGRAVVTAPLADVRPDLSRSSSITLETDEQIRNRIDRRFRIIASLANAAFQGNIKALTISGPPGLGKSYTVEQAQRKHDPSGERSVHVKGHIKATGLYKTLYQYRDENCVVVLDDADGVFMDETSLNILKAVCDSNPCRTVSWKSERTLYDDDENPVPSTFEFRGAMIFISNYDFDHMIAKGHRFRPHLEALMSRSHYIDMAMTSARDYLVRIRQIVTHDMMQQRGYDGRVADEVIDFIENRYDHLREVSIRQAIKLADIAAADHGDISWQEVAEETELKKTENGC